MRTAGRGGVGGEERKGPWGTPSTPVSFTHPRRFSGMLTVESFHSVRGGWDPSLFPYP